MNKPRGRNGGRKPSSSPPKDKRTAQLRKSQKTYRERRLNRLRELENKEKLLEQTLSELSEVTKKNKVLNAMLQSSLSNTLAYNISSLNVKGDNMPVCALTKEYSNLQHSQVEHCTSKDYIQLYDTISENLYSLCGDKDCRPFCRTSSITPPTTMLNIMNDASAFCSTEIPPSYSFDNSLRESFDLFNFVEASLQNPVPHESQNWHGSLPKLATNHYVAKSEDSYISELLSTSVLLPGADICYFVLSFLQTHFFDLSDMLLKLKKEAVCINHDVVIGLDTFVRLVTSCLM